MDEIGFPKQLGTEAFRKALVRIHRMVALGHKLDEYNLLHWVEQYSRHLLEVKEHK
jgi:hypothetical protein